MSLQQSWQQQRQQRQQEVVQRQKMVNEMLIAAQQERQTKAAQLHDELSLFRESISSQDLLRRQEFKQFQTEMQLFCMSLQKQVQSFLTAASDRRQIEAEKLAISLDAFVKNIRQQTQEFLATASVERAIMAEQLEQELGAFVAALRVDVQNYLSEMAVIREDRAIQLNRMLTQSRVDCKAEMEAMFQQLAEFRVELKNYYASIQDQVWGHAKSAQPRSDFPKAAVVESKAPASKALIAISPSITVKQDSVGTDSSKSKSNSKDGVALEKEVYNFIHNSQGARLTQIESSLGINRFQAVDTLRSLIKKGLISQRDRVYLTIEDLASPQT
jgi:hypothetical protein